MRKRLPKSIRKFIRKEKSRIRKQVFSLKEQQEQINKLYDNFFKKSAKIIELVKTA